MAKEYKIAATAAVQSTIGGETNADEWYNSKDSSGKILGLGQGNAVTLRFAKGGTYASPVWGSGISLGSSSTSFDAAYLKDGIDAGLKDGDGNKVVKVEVSASGGGTENFYARINDNNLNIYPPA